jgi:hypothetical protein
MVNEEREMRESRCYPSRECKLKLTHGFSDAAGTLLSILGGFVVIQSTAYRIGNLRHSRVLSTFSLIKNISTRLRPPMCIKSKRAFPSASNTAADLSPSFSYMYIRRESCYVLGILFIASK